MYKYQISDIMEIDKTIILNIRNKMYHLLLTKYILGYAFMYQFKSVF